MAVAGDLEPIGHGANGIVVNGPFVGDGAAVVDEVELVNGALAGGVEEEGADARTGQVERDGRLEAGGRGVGDIKVAAVRAESDAVGGAHVVVDDDGGAGGGVETVRGRLELRDNVGELEPPGVVGGGKPDEARDGIDDDVVAVGEC